MNVFVTGGTGYIGQLLIPELQTRRHRVRVLARPSSTCRVPAGAMPVVGDALDPDSVTAALKPGEAVIHLVGTPHPNPWKAKEFQKVDLASIRATVTASARIGISHLVYVSVAHPAPIMRAYIEARQAGEKMIKEAGVTAVVLRPWYVLGPGRRWPLALLPLYKIAEWLPSSRETARRLGLVTIEQMVQGLVEAVENPPLAGQIRVVDVPAIRCAGRPYSRNPAAAGRLPETPSLNDNHS